MSEMSSAVWARASQNASSRASHLLLKGNRCLRPYATSFSGLLSVEGKKVLHMDRNDYYGTLVTPLHLQCAGSPGHRNLAGGESASLNLTQVSNF